jgi:hypothetical protein
MSAILRTSLTLRGFAHPDDGPPEKFGMRLAANSFWIIFGKPPIRVS